MPIGSYSRSEHTAKRRLSYARRLSIKALFHHYAVSCPATHIWMISMECCGRHVARLKVILLLICCALATCTTAEAKGAVITLHAKWQNAPLLLEAVEFLVSNSRHYRASKTC